MAWRVGEQFQTIYEKKIKLFFSFPKLLAHGEVLLTNSADLNNPDKTNQI